MTYGEQVISRLNIPGAILLAIGAVAVYASRALARRMPEEKREKTSLIIKCAGCAAALAGALLLLDII